MLRLQSGPFGSTSVTPWISLGTDQVSPSSSLCTIQNAKLLRVWGNKIRPGWCPDVVESCTGATLPMTSGLPQMVLAACSAGAACFNGDHVKPPSVERFTTKSVCAKSLQFGVRASAKASNAPLFVLSNDGILKQA
eukprot:CAMPEP_0115315312 /NCGR_PEP_ID=MMETSP0270-20121206/77509_1 /TAXON_ID=71861 /ORGANISM="Scrippsiella trochoidea, Strain CCMP3099" /LENGTH=135 /DNA_ID=CAMNT_0002734617 /DNA_START=71 /DNA_END=478 /DNA_ORIENTATION=+